MELWIATQATYSWQEVIGAFSTRALARAACEAEEEESIRWIEQMDADLYGGAMKGPHEYSVFRVVLDQPLS